MEESQTSKESIISTIIIAGLLFIGGFFIYRSFVDRETLSDMNQDNSAEEVDNEENTASAEIPDDKYIVSAEDNLWSIAEKFYGDGFLWREIAKANDIPETRPLVEEGDELTIPSLEEINSLAQGETDGDIYIVQAGDSLWSLAQKFLGDGFSWKELAQVNNISLDNPLIEPGQELTVSGFGGPSDDNGDVLSAINAEKNDQGEVISEETYTVQKGDTLWSIAKQFYGDGAEWNKIFEYGDNNLSTYTASNGLSYPLIHTGNILVIP